MPSDSLAAAPTFHERRGFEVVATIDDDPRGHRNLLMRKRWQRLSALVAVEESGERLSTDELVAMVFLPPAESSRRVWTGHSFCLGAPLVRLEGQVARRTLLQRTQRLCLAVPHDAIRWRKGLVLRGVTALPVYLERNTN